MTLWLQEILAVEKVSCRGVQLGGNEFLMPWEFRTLNFVGRFE